MKTAAAILIGVILGIALMSYVAYAAWEKNDFYDFKKWKIVFDKWAIAFTLAAWAAVIVALASLTLK